MNPDIRNKMLSNTMIIDMASKKTFYEYLKYI
jgi:hypothetical protein